MSPERKSAMFPIGEVSMGDNPLVCEPYEDRSVDLLKFQSAIVEDNIYIGGGTNNTLCQIQDGECDQMSIQAACQAFGIVHGYDGARDSISIREICKLLASPKSKSLLFGKLVRGLIQRLENGSLTLTGATVDTGIHVLRGGLPNA